VRQRQFFECAIVDDSWRDGPNDLPGVDLRMRSGLPGRIANQDEPHEDQLKPGETTLQVHKEWGEPDLRKDLGAEFGAMELRPGARTATTWRRRSSTPRPSPANEGKFLDLKFIEGKLVSWSESERTMPAKQGAGFSYGLGPGGAVSPVQHY